MTNEDGTTYDPCAWGHKELKDRNKKVTKGHIVLVIGEVAEEGRDYVIVCTVSWHLSIHTNESQILTTNSSQVG